LGSIYPKYPKARPIKITADEPNENVLTLILPRRYPVMIINNNKNTEFENNCMFKNL